MKLVPVMFFLPTLASAARPSIRTLDTKNSTSTTGDYCILHDGHPEASTNWANWGSCCSGKKTSLLGWCRCLKPGESFPTTGAGGEYGAENCCAKSHYGGYEVNYADGTCGCGKWKSGSGGVDTWNEKSCCSGLTEEGDHGTQCAQKKCGHKGEDPVEGVCCATLQSSGYERDGKCGCLHAHEKPDEEDVGRAEDCCSGKVGSSGYCQALDDGATLKDGAVAGDCSSGKEKDGVCQEAECTMPGQTKKSDGAHCCATEMGDDKCGCFHADHKLDTEHGQTQNLCCSLKAVDGKCTHHAHGEELIGAIGADKSDCASGVVLDGKCACVKNGESAFEAHDRGGCCSGRVHEGKCACAKAKWDVLAQFGGAISDCCSGRADEGICSCSLPGRASTSNLDGGNCCIPHSEDSGHCGCITSDGSAVNQTTKPYECCSLIILEDADHHKTCGCIPSGSVVASYVTKASCCSGEKSGNKCS